MIVDLHNHTKVYSQCSHLDPHDLVRRARAAGLDGMVLTEHDAIWPREDFDQIAADDGFLLLRGIEVTTDIGHVLAFGFDRWHEEMRSVERLRELAQEEGAMLYMAHPRRAWRKRPPDDELAGMFASMETLNGQEPPYRNAEAAALSDACALPGIGGSDAHFITWIAICATEFEADLRDEAGFLRELRAGRYRTIDRRLAPPDAAPPVSR